MRKGTILLAVLFAVAASSAAEAAKKKAAAAKPDPAVGATQQSQKFIADAWQPWRTTHAAPAAAKPKAKGKKKKS